MTERATAQRVQVVVSGERESRLATTLRAQVAAQGEASARVTASRVQAPISANPAGLTTVVRAQVARAPHTTGAATSARVQLARAAEAADSERRATSERLQVVVQASAFPSDDAITASQAVVLALVAQASPVQAAQAVALLLGAEPADVRAAQAVALVLGKSVVSAQTAQAAVLALGVGMACVTAYCQILRIERTDGEVYCFTDHDTPVLFRGEIYSPCNGLQASASQQAVTTTGGAGDVQVVGLLSDEDIREQDVVDGLFDAASIELWEVPWDGGDMIPRRIMKGTLNGITATQSSYTAEIMTPAVRMSQQPLLQNYTPGCQYRFGDSRCGKDLTALRQTGSAMQVAARDASAKLQYRQFYDGLRFEPDDYYNYGELTWTSGDNIGRSSEIKSYRSQTITLWSPMPYEIQPGDEYTITPGCSKTSAACKGWNNYVNFGGFPDVPGQDTIMETPSAKLP